MEREEKKARWRNITVACEKHAAGLRDAGWRLYRLDNGVVRPCAWCLGRFPDYGWEYEYVTPQQLRADRLRAAAQRRGPASYRQGGGERARAGKWGEEK